MTCVANPCGFKSRYNLYDAFADHILDVVGGDLLTVDLAFGDDENALNPAAERNLGTTRQRITFTRACSRL